jgi:membrane protein YdbS with pleckstrin-like domain
MALPRRFLNEDEEFLVELRPHWVFFAGPLFVAALAVAIVIAILVAVPSMPNWAADTLWVLAGIPVLWLVGRLLRWRGYTLALTTTRILLRRGVLDRDIVQIRLQRITEINLSQKLWERALSTGRLIVDVQGEDDAIVLEFVRKPAVVQRVINGQINELVGGGNAEPIPAELRQIDSRSNRSRTRQGAPEPEPEYEDEYEDRYEPERETESKTPPFGIPVVSAQDRTVVYPAPDPAVSPTAIVPIPATAPTPVAAGSAPPHGSGPSEIRDRLIELDDLRQRGIISQEEFAAKKAELLSRI